MCDAADPQHLDHDHRNGWVRGILCFNCNGGLGRSRDSDTRLARAITYLRGTTWQRVLIHPGVYQMCSPTRGRPPSRSFCASRLPSCCPAVGRCRRGWPPTSRRTRPPLSPSRPPVAW
ncbi:endonuclease domain-containing protein [Micromonospora sp. CPCC 206060]|uniref:endonuclease domain-containing protein n=1 Tax=Micromonospora sp. CPCC 206060 TaxID=3122406 RepID=UPI002FF32A63